MLSRLAKLRQTAAAAAAELKASNSDPDAANKSTTAEGEVSASTKAFTTTPKATESSASTTTSPAAAPEAATVPVPNDQQQVSATIKDDQQEQQQPSSSSSSPAAAATLAATTASRFSRFKSMVASYRNQVEEEEEAAAAAAEAVAAGASPKMTKTNVEEDDEDDKGTAILMATSSATSSVPSIDKAVPEEKEENDISYLMFGGIFDEEEIAKMKKVKDISQDSNTDATKDDEQAQKTTTTTTVEIALKAETPTSNAESSEDATATAGPEKASITPAGGVALEVEQSTNVGEDAPNKEVVDAGSSITETNEGKVEEANETLPTEVEAEAETATDKVEVIEEGQKEDKTTPIIIDDGQEANDDIALQPTTTGVQEDVGNATNLLLEMANGTSPKEDGSTNVGDDTKILCEGGANSSISQPHEDKERWAQEDVSTAEEAMPTEKAEMNEPCEEDQKEWRVIPAANDDNEGTVKGETLLNARSMEVAENEGALKAGLSMQKTDDTVPNAKEISSVEDDIKAEVVDTGVTTSWQCGEEQGGLGQALSTPGAITEVIADEDKEEPPIDPAIDEEKEVTEKTTSQPSTIKREDPGFVEARDDFFDNAVAATPVHEEPSAELVPVAADTTNPGTLEDADFPEEVKKENVIEPKSQPHEDSDAKAEEMAVETVSPTNVSPDTDRAIDPDKEDDIAASSSNDCDEPVIGSPVVSDLEDGDDMSIPDQIEVRGKEIEVEDKDKLNATDMVGMENTSATNATETASADQDGEPDGTEESSPIPTATTILSDNTRPATDADIVPELGIDGAEGGEKVPTILMEEAIASGAVTEAIENASIDKFNYGGAENDIDVTSEDIALAPTSAEGDKGTVDDQNGQQSELEPSVSKQADSLAANNLMDAEPVPFIGDVYEADMQHNANENSAQEIQSVQQYEVETNSYDGRHSSKEEESDPVKANSTVEERNEENVDAAAFVFGDKVAEGESEDKDLASPEKPEELDGDKLMEVDMGSFDELTATGEAIPTKQVSGVIEKQPVENTDCEADDVPPRVGEIQGVMPVAPVTNPNANSLDEDNLKSSSMTQPSSLQTETLEEDRPKDISKDNLNETPKDGEAEVAESQETPELAEVALNLGDETKGAEFENLNEVMDTIEDEDDALLDDLLDTTRGEDDEVVLQEIPPAQAKAPELRESAPVTDTSKAASERRKEESEIVFGDASTDDIDDKHLNMLDNLLDNASDEMKLASSSQTRKGVVSEAKVTPKTVDNRTKRTSTEVKRSAARSGPGQRPTATIKKNMASSTPALRGPPSVVRATIMRPKQPATAPKPRTPLGLSTSRASRKISSPPSNKSSAPARSPAKTSPKSQQPLRTPPSVVRRTPASGTSTPSQQTYTPVITPSSSYDSAERSASRSRLLKQTRASLAQKSPPKPPTDPTLAASDHVLQRQLRSSFDEASTVSFGARSVRSVRSIRSNRPPTIPKDPNFALTRKHGEKVMSSTTSLSRIDEIPAACSTKYLASRLRKKDELHQIWQGKPTIQKPFRLSYEYMGKVPNYSKNVPSKHNP